MARPHHEWYRRGLGPRIDALDLALKGIVENQPEAMKSARKVAQSLSSSSLAYGFTNIHAAAKLVIEAPPDQVVEHTRALISLLRQLVSGIPREAPLILVVGGEESFREELCRLLEASGKQVIAARTGRETYRIVLNRNISLIVMDMFLPDQDGRLYIRSLHSRPLTAAIPIIAIDAPIARHEKESDLLKEADLWLTRPVEPRKVADLITAHLRRAHEIVRAALRDQLTGLPNRAAFSESFDQTMLNYNPAREPITLAVISIDKLDPIQQAHGEETANQVLQHVGSVLSISFRATDTVARWDSSHFAVMFPGEDYYGGACAIEKAMAALARRPFLMPDGTTAPLTLCVGLIVLADRIACPEAVDRALNFLYQAEMEGGNRIRGFDSAPSGHKATVAVIMEESHTCRIVQQLLLNDGFEVTLYTALTEEDWPALTSQRFHLVVLGEQLGASSGLDLLERLRSLPQFNRTPVIILTSREETAIKALELGANDYLVKPFVPQSFTSHLRRIMVHGIKERRLQKALDVLVIDDEVAALVIAGTTLGRMAGFSVRLAFGARDGLARLAGENAAVVVINTAPRDMTVNEFLEKGRAANAFGRNPAILVSATEKQRLQALALLPAGVKAILTKPFTPTGLVKEFTALLPQPPGPPAPPPDNSLLNTEIRRVIMRSSGTPA